MPIHHTASDHEILDWSEIKPPGIICIAEISHSGLLHLHLLAGVLFATPEWKLLLYTGMAADILGAFRLLAEYARLRESL